MAHFAQLNDRDEVVQIIVVNNSDCGDLPFPESEEMGINFCRSLFGDGTKWVQTSYNANFRGQYAAIGGYYIRQSDIFTGPQPYPSWTLDLETGKWSAPVPMPEAPPLHMAVWDEQGQEWDIVLDGDNV